MVNPLKIKKANTLLLKNLENILNKGSKLIRNEAVKRVPVDTGRLKNSITINKVHPYSYIISSDLKSPRYSEYVEFGTVFQPPQPYLRPAWAVGVKFFKAELKKMVLDV